MAKRGTYMNQPAVPTYPVDAVISAARDLRLVADRYLRGRASAKDVDEAIRWWQDAQQAARTPR